jgi:hypothetical protein
MITINAKCILLRSQTDVCDGLLVDPIPPVCRQYVVKLFLGFGVDPPADDAATWECERMFALAIDDGEFHIPIERSGLYWLPIHNGRSIHHRL